MSALRLKSVDSKGEDLNKFLEAKAHWIRRETLRIHKIAPETRVASSLSLVEIFTVLYYGGVINFNAKEPFWDLRDRLIISKGHGSICMYPLLADLGYFDSKELDKACSEGSFLGGIPDPIIPGYETVNGSLGHGVGVACGMALALQKKNKKSQVFCVTGDGELHEGSIWEGFMFAAHHKLDNLNIIVDWNQTCMLDRTEKVVGLSPIKEKLEAFGFEVCTVDGHNVANLNEVLHTMKGNKPGKPKALIANTVKGKGVPQLEANSLCHVMALKPGEIDEIMEKMK